MKATINAKPSQYAGFAHDGKIRQHRKEKNFYAEYSVLVTRKDSGYPASISGSMHAVVVARLYATNSDTVHACIWINSPTRKNQQSVSISGGGKAGGYGYHKASAALEAALDDAQITLSEAIGGSGETAMTEALEAVARAIGYKKFHIHHAHA